MKNFAKLLVVAGSVAVLAACSSSDNASKTNAQMFGGYSVTDLQQRYNTVYFEFDSYDVQGEYASNLRCTLCILKVNTSF